MVQQKNLSLKKYINLLKQREGLKLMSYGAKPINYILLLILIIIIIIIIIITGYLIFLTAYYKQAKHLTTRVKIHFRLITVWTVKWKTTPYPTCLETVSGVTLGKSSLLDSGS